MAKARPRHLPKLEFPAHRFDSQICQSFNSRQIKLKSLYSRSFLFLFQQGHVKAVENRLGFYRFQIKVECHNF